MKSKNQMIIFSTSIVAMGYSLQDFASLAIDLGFSQEQALKFESSFKEFGTLLDNITSKEISEAFKEAIQEIIKD
jgi:hypothetical protein